MSFQRSIICPNTFRGFRGRIGKQKNGKFRFSSPRVDMGTEITPLESYELTGFLRICTTTFGALLKFHDFILKNPVNSYDSNGVIDRKSTRLNSSHTVISYAAFCL